MIFNRHVRTPRHLGVLLAMLPLGALPQSPGPAQPHTPAPSEAPLQVVTLQPGDDFAERRYACFSDIFLASGEPLAKLDGQLMLVRLNTPVYAGEKKPASPLIGLVALDKSRSFGRYQFTFKGFGPAEERTKARERLYKIVVQASGKTYCAAQAGWHCNTLQGTMTFDWGWGGDGYLNHAELTNITLRDQCKDNDPQDEGLLVFTGLLDRLGATIFMGGSR